MRPAALALLLIILQSLAACGDEPLASDGGPAPDLLAPRPDAGPPPAGDAGPPAPSPPPFSLVFLPDTQYYTRYYPALLRSQVEWVRANREAEKIAFVLHGGDITDTNAPTEWGAAQASLALLDGELPYALAVGNHDTGAGGKTGTRDTSLFEATFPVSRYQGGETLGGLYDPSSLVNCYHRFEAGGVKWLILVLEFGPRADVLAWADGVVAQHPDRQVILLTHTYLYYDETLHGSKLSHSWSPHSYPVYGLEGGASDGVEIWNGLVRKHRNLAFVLNGHILGDGAGRLVSVGDEGNRVYQLLANYQSMPQGGSGWLRLLRFDPGARRVAVETYSPFLGREDFSTQQRFAFEDLELFAGVDRTPPWIESVSPVDDATRLVVRFSETVDRGSAADTARYVITPDIAIAAADLDAEGRTVVLTTSVMARGTPYQLAVAGVTDRASPPNAMAAGATQDFRREAVLLAEDFSDNNMVGWTVVDDATLHPELLAEWKLAAPSDWQVVSQRLEQRSNIYSGTAATESGRKGTFAYWSAPAARLWRDYTLRVTLHPQDDDGIGVLLRYQDEQNYYKLELDGERGFRKLIRLRQGQETVLAAEAGGYQPGAPVALEVAVGGDTLEVRLAGTTLFGGPVTDTPGGVAAGAVALYCWGEAGIAFDDVVVTAPP